MGNSLRGTYEFVGVTFRNAAQNGDPARLTKGALKLLAVADRHIDDALAAHHGHRLACAQGCSACCHRLVKASLPEVLLAAEHIEREWTSDQRAALTVRVQQNQIQNSPYWRNETLTAEAPCPFLVEDSCSIYAYRPLACRSANSFSKADCEEHYQKGAEGAPMGIATITDLADLSYVAGEGCQRGGLASGLFDFGATVAALVEAPELLGRLRERAGPLERFKLVSEWNGVPDTGTPRSAAEFSAAAVKPLLDLARTGDAAQIRSTLPSVAERPAKVLLGMTLPALYPSQDSLLEWWSHLSQAIEKFEDSRLNPGELFEAVHYFNTFNWAYAGQDVRPYMERFMRKLHDLARAASPQLASPIDHPRRPGRFRLGYISTRLKAFNGSRWALGLLTNQSPDIESYVINLTEREDDTSIAFRRRADHYVHLPVEAIEAGHFVRSLDLDAILFTDVGMCGRSLQLASMRLARRQFCGWGHPVTTGSPTMDYYVSSELMEPPGGEAHYTEKLLRLPGNGLSTPFRPAIPSRKSSNELGVPPHGFLVYAQISNKHIPAHDPLFARVIAESKKPVVFLGATDEEMKSTLRNRLGTQNTLFLDALPRPDYLRVLELADCSLESPAFGGAFTAIDALSVGTPVLTLPGLFMRGRLSVGYLQACGIGGFQAKSEDDFTSLATDPNRRDAEMESFDASRLFDNVRAITEFERFLLT